MKMPVDDDLIAMMTTLLELGLGKEQIFQNLEKRLLNGLGKFIDFCETKLEI